MDARKNLRPRLYNSGPVAHVVRRTVVSLGPLYIVREEHRYDGDGLRVITARRKRWYPAGIAALLCVSAGGIALAATGGPIRGDYFISIPVPDREPMTAGERKETATHRRAHRVASVGPAVTRALTDNAPSDPVQVTTTLTRAAAISVALRTGEMQEWRTGGEGGFVVAGPSDREGMRECRDLSILTRATGVPDRVDQRRECRRGVGG